MEHAIEASIFEFVVAERVELGVVNYFNVTLHVPIGPFQKGEIFVSVSIDFDNGILNIRGSKFKLHLSLGEEVK